MTLSNLKIFIRIEDETRIRMKNELIVKQKATTNIVAANSEKGNNLSFNKKKLFNKRKNQNPKNLNVQKKEFKKSGKCFNCGNNISDWWLDTGATCHVCSNRDLFSSYAVTKKNVSMADHSVIPVLGTRTMVLTLSLGKTLTLKDVKHVLLIVKNLVFGSLLCDAGSWTLEPTPSLKLEMQNSLRISLSKIKAYCSKI
ncbi:uncharacterized protein LOC109841590 [Asparagus officinalis]|uniref:uncharacterized protein LOC109841590 n=1 Tax=Asparagus officinalis TaxID=4686 RepID=UPI00098E46F8|nr:uncharacterized protein LOC109841590 [Asparagus officinalis]